MKRSCPRVAPFVVVLAVLGCGGEQKQESQPPPQAGAGSAAGSAAGSGPNAGTGAGAAGVSSTAGVGGAAAAGTDAPIAGAAAGTGGQGGTAPPQAGASAGAAPVAGTMPVAGTTPVAGTQPVAGTTPVAGTQPAAGTMPVAGTSAPEPTTGLFPPVTDFMQAGPYTPSTLANVGPANNYYVYYPMESAPEGARNPLVAWTSGGGTSHIGYTLLPHLASHGFVVVTANTIPGIGAEAALGDEMVAGIDWVLEENDRAGSELHDRIDADHIAASGYSMGSLATFMMATDPRLTTTVHISGGNMAPERVQNLHAPAAFICGTSQPGCSNILSGACDIAAENCDMDFENATTPVFYANFGAGHLGILTSPFMERINAMTTAWLRYYLMGDTTLESLFMGDSCEYCSDANWTVQQKNF